MCPAEDNNDTDSPDLFEKNFSGLSFKLIDDWEKPQLELVYAAIRSGAAISSGNRHSHNSKKNSDQQNENQKFSPNSLSGRGLIHFVNTDKFGCVAVKQYRRGGLVSLLIKERYLLQNKIRPARELDILKEAQNLGVNVPRPLGYVTQGKLFYKAWLLTKEIPSHKSLSEIAIQEANSNDTTNIAELISDLVAQVSILIAARIYHVDLHPGNTVVSGDRRVYILDFDKATKANMEPKELRDKYLIRWRRAVIKHNLPEILSEAFCLGLRRSAILDS